jgi:hypothetical protein
MGFDEISDWSWYRWTSDCRDTYASTLLVSLFSAVSGKSLLKAGIGFSNIEV